MNSIALLIRRVHFLRYMYTRNSTTIDQDLAAGTNSKKSVPVFQSPPKMSAADETISTTHNPGELRRTFVERPHESFTILKDPRTHAPKKSKLVCEVQRISSISYDLHKDERPVPGNVFLLVVDCVCVCVHVCASTYNDLMLVVKGTEVWIRCS